MVAAAAPGGYDGPLPRPSRANLTTASLELAAAASSGTDRIARRAASLSAQARPRQVRIGIVEDPGSGRSTLLRAIMAHSSRLSTAADSMLFASVDIEGLVRTDGSPSADVFVVVISAVDPIVSPDELNVLSLIASHQCPRLVVVNKTDQVAHGDLPMLHRRVIRGVLRATGELERPWCLAAAPALAARGMETEPGPDTGDFSAFEAELERLCIRTLPDAREDTNRRRLMVVAQQLVDLIDIETAALDREHDDLMRLSAQFHALATKAAGEMSKARVSYDKDVEVLTHRLSANLVGVGRQVPGRSVEFVKAKTANTAVGDLPDRIRFLAGRALQAELDEFVQMERGFAQRMWGRVVEGFRARTEAGVNDLRVGTNTLIGAALPRVIVEVTPVGHPLAISPFPNRQSTLAVDFEPFRGLRHRVLGKEAARRRLFDRLSKVVAVDVDRNVSEALVVLEDRRQADVDQLSDALMVELDDFVDLVLHGIGRAEGLSRLSSPVRESELKKDLAARAMAVALVENLGL